MKIVVSEKLREILKNVYDFGGISSSLIGSEFINDEYFKNDCVNYLDISHTDKLHLSYLTQERVEKINETEDKNYWKIKMRYHGRAGSVVKKIFNCFDDRMIEDFVIKYQGIVDKKNFHFEIVKGEDIRKYYHHSKYYSQSGNLGMSCMKSDMCQDFFQIYVDNEDKINMLIMLDEHNRLFGRALLWMGDDFRFMDRIYTINDIFNVHFINWSIENKYVYKQKQSYTTPLHVYEEGEKKTKKMSIILKKGLYNKYPYLDTFKWLDVPTRTLYNYMPDWFMEKGKRKQFVLADPVGGKMMDDYFMIDDLTKEYYHKDMIVRCKYLNKNAFRANLNYSHVNDDYILPEHSEMSSEINDYIFSGKYSHLNDFEKIKKEKYMNMKIEKVRNVLNILEEPEPLCQNNFREQNIQ